MQSMKLVSDGALGSRGAYLIAPYSDMPNTRGLDITPAEKLSDRVSTRGLKRRDSKPSRLPNPVQSPAARVSRKANSTR